MKKDNLVITALLTGRGNNTLQDKNVLPVFGKPLLFYPAKAAINSKLISNFYISSNCNKILEAGVDVGFKPIQRPEEFSKPDSQHVEVIKHSLEMIELQGIQPDIIVVILANSVTIKTEWINTCIEYLLDDSLLTAAVPAFLDSDHHPYRAKKISTDGLFEPFFDFSEKSISTNRQDLDPSYFLCHNFWVIRTNAINSKDGQPPWSFMGNKIKPYIVDEAFDVHTLEDIKRSEKWLIKNGIVQK